jgi:glutamate-1-semialdehyde 2,1-aminomutase
VTQSTRTAAYLERARRVLAGGVNSNIRLGEKPYPLCFARGRGATLEDLDGRTYVDYVLGMGPVILGHNDARVVEAIIDAVGRGLTFAGQHPDEAEVAERICAAVPSVEAVRFTSSGSEAVHIALRIARAATGRWKVIRFEGHYHGWLDTIYVGQRPEEEGPAAPAVPGTRGQPPATVQDLLVLPWNNREALETTAHLYRGQIGAIILEPILCNTGVIPPKPGYLETIRAVCDREKAVLIFDEVITGFRVALGGAQAISGVRPDLTVFGKAIANGFPLSAVGGRRDLMELVGSGSVMHGGTYNGNLPAMAAARATLDALAADNGAVYGAITATGRALMDGLRRVAADVDVPVTVQGPGPIFYLWMTTKPSIDNPRTAKSEGAEARGVFGQSMLQRGVRLVPDGRWHVSAAHSAQHLSQTLQAAREAFLEVRAAGLA